MCSLCAWKARQPSQSHADARVAREGRCKDGKPSLRFVCLTFGRGEERRIRQRTRGAIQRAHSDAKSEAEARAPVRHSIQCPWTPLQAGCCCRGFNSIPPPPACRCNPDPCLLQSFIPTHRYRTRKCHSFLQLLGILSSPSVFTQCSLSSLIVVQDQARPDRLR